MNEGRRCALPGCYVVIEPESDGRPQRKYCTAAHRAVARQMRREGTHRSATAPPLPIPAPAPPEPVRELIPTTARRRRDIAIAAMRRCRAAAVLGSAGLLVTGSGLMAASSPVGMPTASSTIPWNAADPDAQQKWASQAQITLASLDTQINQVDKAQQAWDALPEQRKYAPLPTPIHNLKQQRQLLVTRRTALQTEINTYQQAQQASQHLADTEDGLSAIQNTLDQGSSQIPSPDQAQTTRLLRQEQQQQQEQRDAQFAQLTSLRDDIQRTMAQPLPADDNTTKSITSQVSDLVAHPELDKPSRQPDHSNARPTSPEVTAPREQDGPEVDQVGNGAPPNPGRARPEVPQGPQVLAEGSQPLPDMVPGPVNGAAKQLGGALDGVTQALPKVPTVVPAAPVAPIPALVPAPSVLVPSAHAPAAPAPTASAPGQGGVLGGVTQALPRVAPQTPPAPTAQAPSIQTPAPINLAAPGRPSGDGLGGMLNNAGKSLGGTAGSLTQPLSVTPAPSTNIAPPAQQAPNNSDGGLLNSPTLPLNLASGPSGNSPQASPATLSDGGNDGFDHVVSPPVHRVSDSTPSSSSHSSSHSSDHGAWDIPEQPTPTPTVIVPSTPIETPSNSGSHDPSSHDPSSDDEKAKAAGDIAGSVLGGDMGDLVSSAVRAKEAQDHGSSSTSSTDSDSGWGSSSVNSGSSSGSGDGDDLRNSIMKDYGLGSDSDSHSSSDSNSHQSSDGGWSNMESSSGHNSSDVDSIINHYTDGSDDKNSDHSDSSSHDSGSDDDWASMATSYSGSHDSNSRGSDSDSHSSRDDDNDSSYLSGSSHNSDSRDSDSDSNDSHDSYSDYSHSRDSDSRDTDSSDDRDSHDSHSDNDSHDEDSSSDSDSDSHDSDSDSGDSHDSDSDSGGDDD